MHPGPAETGSDGDSVTGPCQTRAPQDRFVTKRRGREESRTLTLAARSARTARVAPAVEPGAQPGVPNQ